LARTLNDTVATYLEVLAQHLLAVTEESLNDDDCSSEQYLRYLEAYHIRKKISTL
jgi:hypothetical protein